MTAESMLSKRPVLRITAASFFPFELFSSHIYYISKFLYLLSKCFCSNLLSNPLDCNCHLAWLSPWLRHRSVAAGNPRCEKPRFLKRFPVADINPRDFRCTTEEMTSPLPTCIPEKKCPKRCECSGNFNEEFLYFCSVVKITLVKQEKWVQFMLGPNFINEFRRKS